MKTFKHGGDLGDIIYALPTMKALGGGKLVLTVMPGTRVRMNEDQRALLDRLLTAQNYIYGVELDLSGKPNPVDYDLDRFRGYWGRYHSWGTSIAEYVADSFGVDRAVLNEPWITRPIIHQRDNLPEVVFARSERYRNPHFPWKLAHRQYLGHSAFVGTEKEHKDFCQKVGDIPFFPTPDLYAAAGVIGAAKLFIGNQSCPYAIAEAMKVNTFQEVHLHDPNCRFHRSNATYIAGEHAVFPNLSEVKRRPYIGIVTLYDDAAKSYGVLTAAQKENYARQWGYGMEIFTECPRPEWPATWNKLLVLEKVLEKYDWVFWTDADALILDPRVPLETFIDDRVDWILGGDEHGINCGGFFLRNSPMGKRILSTLLNGEILMEPQYEQTKAKEMLWHNPDILACTRFRGDAFNTNTWAKAKGTMLHLWAKSHEERFKIISEMLCRKN